MHTIAMPIANSVSGDIFFFMLDFSFPFLIVLYYKRGQKSIGRLHKIGRKDFSIFVQKNY